MDISEFDVILRMDWLTAHRVIMDCDHRRVIAYTPNDVCVMFQGISTMLYLKSCTTLDGTGS